MKKMTTTLKGIYPEIDFSGLPADEAGQPAIFSDTDYGIRKIVNIAGWKAIRHENHAFGDGSFFLATDARGERGSLPLGRWPQDQEALKFLTQYRDWEHYRQVRREDEVASLRSKLARAEEKEEKLRDEIFSLKMDVSKLEISLKLIGDKNQAGGPGSRREVRKLVEEHVSACSECDRFVCACD